MEIKDQLIKEKLPQHIAVIMDGNGRWAKALGKARVFGHRSGVKAVREITEAAAEIGISFLTLYAFSTENWNRPQKEVNALMNLLIETIGKEIGTLQKNNIALNAIGDFDQLPDKTRSSLLKAIEETSSNDHMTLTLALNYSSRWELTHAMKSIAEDVEKGKLSASSIDESTITRYLQTANMPDPELLIRTSGEQRISNYLLWQIAYTELYFTSKMWPDMRKNDFYEAILHYQNRERRFGKTSEQILRI